MELKNKLVPTQFQIQDSVRQNQTFGYTYLNNPKVACSSIKSALWHHSKKNGQIGYLPVDNELHGIGIWPKEFAEIGQNQFVFSFVRNPYARALSCYLDKFSYQSLVRKSFCAKFGYEYGADISFLEFLRGVNASHSNLDDPHWRPQSDNILVGIVPISFIGHLEHFDKHFSQVRKKLSLAGEGAEARPHKTNAIARIREFFVDEAVELVQKKYREDFANFGYSLDISQLDPINADPLLSLPLTDYENNRFANAVGLQCSNPQEAIRLLDPLRRNPNSNPFIYQTLYSSFINSNDLQNAEVAIAECQQWFPESETALNLKLNQLIHGRCFSEAVAIAEMLVKIDPANITYRSLIGNVLLATGNAKRALEAADFMMNFDPSVADGHVICAKARLKIKKEEKAIKSKHEASKLGVKEITNSKNKQLATQVSSRSESWLKKSIRSVKQKFHDIKKVIIERQ